MFWAARNIQSSSKCLALAGVRAFLRSLGQPFRPQCIYLEATAYAVNPLNPKYLKEKNESKAGRNPKLESAMYCFNEEEHLRFLSIFGKSDAYAGMCRFQSQRFEHKVCLFLSLQF